jgi:hypothetical protein
MWHGTRNEVMKKRWPNKDDGRSRPGINLQIEIEEVGSSGNEVRWIRRAALV